MDRDFTMASAAYALGFMLAVMFSQPAAPRLGVFLICLCWAALFIWYQGKGRAEFGRAGMAAMAAALTLALSLVLNANRSLYLPNLMAIAMLMGAGAGLSRGMGGAALSWRRPRVLIAAPFYMIGLLFVNADKFFRAIGSRIRNKIFWKAALGLALSLPAAGVVLALLSSADSQFGSMVKGLMFFSPAVELALERLFWAVPAAALFYSLPYGLKRGRELKNVPLAHERSPGKSDGVIAASLLGVMCVIYTAFVYVQFAYLFSRALPSDMTYAEYARGGFFELAFVTFLNLCLALGAVTFTKSRADGGFQRTIRALCGVLLAFTLVILASAVYRMFMYVDIYGLTVLRFLVLWGELVMLVCILLTGLKTIKPEFKAFPAMACVTLALYLALNLCNMDALIARYNVNLHLSDDTRMIDTEYLSRLSPDTYFALERTRAVTGGPAPRREAYNLWSWNLTSWRVDKG
ncbi:MAG: DUF4173 domain-containing protein [Oscillospiraceae bacterium]|nr:DUF4173 domain-containing protein [Oscillospiraceae bacterium]